MSLRRAFLGIRPRVTARPPQKGSTSRRDACSCQIGSRWGISQRLPPAHLRGGVSNMGFDWFKMIKFVEFTGSYSGVLSESLMFSSTAFSNSCTFFAFFWFNLVTILPKPGTVVNFSKDSLKATLLSKTSVIGLSELL